MCIVKFYTSCSTVMAELQSRVSGTNGWSDPHNGGAYTLTSVSDGNPQMGIPGKITGQRVTGDDKYTDKFDFTFTGTGISDEPACNVSACSESQVSSVVDYSTNYCNLHSLYCTAKEGCPTSGKDTALYTYKETFSACSQHDDVCLASLVATPT